MHQVLDLCIPLLTNLCCVRLYICMFLRLHDVSTDNLCLRITKGRLLIYLNVNGTRSAFAGTLSELYHHLVWNWPTESCILDVRRQGHAETEVLAVLCERAGRDGH